MYPLQARDRQSWLREAQVVHRIARAAELETVRSQEWSEAVKCLADALTVVLMADATIEQDAIRLAWKRLGVER